MEKNRLQGSEFVYVQKEEEQEQEIDFRQFFRVVWTRKWICLIVFVVVVSCTIGYIFYTSPVYEADVSMVYEKTSTTSATVLEEKINPQAAGFSIDVQKVLLANPIVVSEIRNRLLGAGMDLKAEQINGLLKLSVKSSVVDFSAQGGTPGEATALANIAASVLIEKNTEDKRQELDGAISFLSSQMENFDRLLGTTEEKLSKFRQKEGISAFRQEITGLSQKLGDLQQQATEAGIEAGLAKAQLDAIRVQIAAKRKSLAPEAKEVGATTTLQVEELRSRILQMQNDLLSKQAVFTDEHPQVVSLKEKISIAQTQLNNEIVRLGQAKGGDPLSEWQNLAAREVQLDIAYQGFEQKRKMIESLVEKFKVEHPELATKDVQLLRLEREKELYKQSYLQLQVKHTEMSLVQQMKGSEMRIINPADERSAKLVKPKKNIIIPLGIVLGLFFGIGSTLFLEFLDNTVKNEQDIEKLGLSVLGVVPWFEKNGAKVKLPVNIRSKFKQQLVELVGRKLNGTSFKNFAKEAYGALGANVLLSGNGNGASKVKILTSPLAKAGKSLTAVNLAIYLAELGRRVLLIDGDLRRSRLHFFFGANRTPGLSEYLAGVDDVPLSSLARATDVDNLFLIPAGKTPQNPSRLFSSEKMSSLLSRSEEDFDFVIVDGPPLFGVADTSFLTRWGEVVVVAMAGGTKKLQLDQARKILVKLDARIAGVVLNGSDSKTGRYNDYYYQMDFDRNEE